MPYSQEHYDEAYRLREHGTDDASIRMILVSRKLTSGDIDELFIALNAALPAKKGKSFGGYAGDETARNIEHRDFFRLMIALMVIGLILGGIGATMSINILWYLGVIIGAFGLWGLARSI